MNNKNEILLRNKFIKELTNLVDPKKIKGTPSAFSEGQIIYKEGDEAKSVYLVAKGKVKLLKKSKKIEVSKNTVLKENYFGLEDVLEAGKRKETAIALNDTFIVELADEDLLYVLEVLKAKNKMIVNDSDNSDYQPYEEQEKFSFKLKEPDNKTQFSVNILDDDTDFPYDELKKKDEINEISINENSDPFEEDSISFKFDEDSELDSSENKHVSEYTDTDNNLEEEDLDFVEIDESDIFNIIESENETFLTEKDKRSYSEPERMNPQNEEEPFINEKRIRDEAELEISDIFDIKEKSGYSLSEQQLEMINNALNKIYSGLDLPSTIQNIVDVAVNLTNADKGVLYLFDKKSGKLTSIIKENDDLEFTEITVGEGFAGYCAKTGEIVNESETFGEKRLKADFIKDNYYKTYSILCFPIRNSEEEITGVIELINSINERFSETDEMILNELSIHSSLAIDNALKTEELLAKRSEESFIKMGKFLKEEIKSPLLLSKSYLENIRKNQMPPKISNVMDMLLEQISGITQKLNSILLFSDKESKIRLINYNLNKTLEDFSYRLQYKLREYDIILQSELSANVKVKLDPYEFYQAFIILIDFLSASMQYGGNILMHTKRKEETVNIYLEANGKPLSEIDRRNLFLPFSDVKFDKSGGIALTVAYKIVKFHQGNLSAFNNENGGITLLINLPISKSA